MRDYTVLQKFALIGLNGLESEHPSVEKTAILKGYLIGEKVESAYFDENVGADGFKKEVEKVSARKISKKEVKEIEKKLEQELNDLGVMIKIPDLLACDLTYETAGIDLKSYYCEKEVYLTMVEEIRAEVLDGGEITEETKFLLWLLRETGCLHDFFSIKEQEDLQKRLLELSVGDEKYNALLNFEFHNSFVTSYLNFLKKKSNFFKNPYLEGVALVFPFLERRKAIFIDSVIFGTTVLSRREATVKHLRDKGHQVEEVKNGEETILRIDNMYYRLFPGSRVRCVPIQGINLVPVYR